MKLGQAGVNIKFMSVAPIDDEKPFNAGDADGADPQGKENEALMILGVDRAIDEAVKKDLLSTSGMFEVGVVVLD